VDYTAIRILRFVGCYQLEGFETMDVMESLTIRRIANGWTVLAGKAATDILHLAITPEALAQYVASWATQQQGKAKGTQA
jgi:hypothetical protein